MKGHKGSHHGKRRANGGSTPMVAAGNPNVIKEAEDRKKGGKVKRATGGKVVGFMTGGTVRPRLDRPGRKTGGRVGADKSPLSSAHASRSPESTGGEPD